MSSPETQQPFTPGPIPPSHRVGSAVFIVTTAVAVVVIGLLAAFVTWRFHPAPAPPCVANCPPPVAKPLAAAAASAAPLTESHDYRSPRFGFSVQFQSPPWGVASTDTAGVLLEAGNGAVAFRIQGGRVGTSPVQLVIDAANSLNPTSFPDVTPDHVLRGARIGTVDGAGEVFAATYVPGAGGGQARAVRVPIIAAGRNGLSVVAVALSPYDRTVPGGVFGGDYLDYLLSEFNWPGG